MKTETKEHEINHVFEKALHQTAERVEPTTAEMQRQHDSDEAWYSYRDSTWADDYPRPVHHIHRGYLLKRLEAAEDTNEALTRELGKANKAADKLEQGIQKFLDGDEPKYTPKFDCEHGTPHYKDCGQCIENYFSGLLKGARDD